MAPDRRFERFRLQNRILRAKICMEPSGHDWKPRISSKNVKNQISKHYCFNLYVGLIKAFPWQQQTFLTECPVGRDARLARLVVPGWCPVVFQWPGTVSNPNWIQRLFDPFEIEYATQKSQNASQELQICLRTRFKGVGILIGTV